MGCRIVCHHKPLSPECPFVKPVLERWLADVNVEYEGAQKSSNGTITHGLRGPAFVLCNGFPRHYSARATDAMQLSSSVQKRHAYYHIHL